jgi:hypothetical protein
LEFGQFCSCLADSPPIGRRRSAWSRLALCSSCSSLVHERLEFNPFFQPSSVAGCLADGPPGVRDSPRGVCWSRTVRGISTDGLLFRVQYWRFKGCFGQSAAALQKVRLGLADGPPRPCRRSAGACGRSVWCYAELLSSLLLEFHFRFGIVWGLFLGLVGPL